MRSKPNDLFGMIGSADEMTGKAGADQRTRNMESSQRYTFQAHADLNDFEIQYQFARAGTSGETAQASELNDLDHPVEKTVSFPS